MEAILRAEGVSMEEGELGANRVDYWSWRDEEKDIEEDEEDWG